MSGKLNVDSGALTGVGNQFSGVANQVRTIFASMDNKVKEVTSNDSWRGEASKAFLDKFLSIKPRLETHLQQLEALGPTIVKVSNSYADTEASNVGIINQG